MKGVPEDSYEPARAQTYDSVANPEATSDTRFKKVRKAEAMGTAAAEPLVVPEKKRRVDDVFSVES